MDNTFHSDRHETALTEWLLRCFALLLFGIAVARLAVAWYADTSRWTLLVFLLSEGFTLMLLLCARRAIIRDLSPLAMAATLYAIFFYVFFDPVGTTRLIPEWVGVVLLAVGTCWQVSAKAVLGRSFGVLPAYRQRIVIAGPYRVVRHPIYMGYFIGHVGVLLASFSLQNLVVMLTLYLAQAVRIQREEMVLSQVDDYRLYQQRVRWRMVPGVY